MNIGAARLSEPLLILAFSLFVTAVALAVSRVLSTIVGRGAAVWRARRRAGARTDEVALLGAAAQRWLLTPAAWGGARDGAFAGVDFDALGRAALPLRPDRRRTAAGLYRLVHVPPCAALDRLARRMDTDAGRDGLLVIGWDETTMDACASLVLGPLVQIRLARVPWAWVGTLVQREATRRRPGRRRSMPTAAPDRPAAPVHGRPTTPARARPLLPGRPSAPDPRGPLRSGPPRVRMRARSRSG